jgi:hypothetical protein
MYSVYGNEIYQNSRSKKDTNKMDPKTKSEESGFDDHFRYPT